MHQIFTAHGKLLLSSEYLVLRGATALAVPLNKGQQLEVYESNAPGLTWQANSPSGTWFNTSFDEDLKILQTTSLPHAQRLQHVLKVILEMDATRLPLLMQKKVVTHLEFDPLWGWGSSSTLLHLLGQWLQVDPWQILDNTFGGSGYDLACAGATQPIFYKRLPGETPESAPAPFQPPFLSQLGIVWLNKKQTSAHEVKRYLTGNKPDTGLLDQVSAISHQMTQVQTLSEFERLLNTHEAIIAQATGQQTVQNTLFPDFFGTTKSLGAWGGDFILFASLQPFENCCAYFQTKGHFHMFKLEDVLLNKSSESTSSQHVIT